MSKTVIKFCCILSFLSASAHSAVTTSHSTSLNTVPNTTTEIDQDFGICQVYDGATCAAYLKNQVVFVPPQFTIDLIEERLKAAYGVIKESKDMNQNCRVFALPSLCYSILPICRNPEKTNYQYFAKKAAYELEQKKLLKKLKSTIAPKRLTEVPIQIPESTTTDTATSPEQTIESLNRNARSFDVVVNAKTKFVHKTQHYVDYDETTSAEFQNFDKIKSNIPAYPPTKESENVRRICRNECELLENELCQKEYAIAKRHPTIGQMLPLEDCHNLPDTKDCSKLGITIDVDETETCYWESGSGYRGTIDRSASGKQCLPWAHRMKEIANYPELAGQSYCRNPGSTEKSPWCFVNNDHSADRSIEICNIPKCSDQMWTYIIIVISAIAVVILTVIICCCRKYKKNDIPNIENINVPNVDKNIYGRSSRMNSPIEMTNLLQNQNGIANIDNGRGASSKRNSMLRIAQYKLCDVNFLEVLGEGAFGKVYKGALSQKNNGDDIFVAVKALKENASAKTQADFKREIKLISDLRHENIVCILGVVLNEEPLCMLFEYMSQGDLHEFLINNSPNVGGKQLTQLQFLSISMQICEGMIYLSDHHYVHRDLAARNCLVGEDLRVKISDFGLSRDIYSSDYYRVQSKSLLPVRWMPSESILYGKFTTESDVWSYGVVLWEIYSYGMQPYYGYSNQEVISMVRARQLLPCPEACPTAVYSLMVECWHEQSDRRPSFPEMGHRLKMWYDLQIGRDGLTSSCNSRKSSTFSMPTKVPSTTVTPSSSSNFLSQQQGLRRGELSSSDLNNISRQSSLGRKQSYHNEQPTMTQSMSNKCLHHSLDRDGSQRNCKKPPIKPTQSVSSQHSKSQSNDLVTPIYNNVN